MERTGQPLEKIERDTDRDNFMSAEEARIRSYRQSYYCHRLNLNKGVIRCLSLMMKKVN